MPDFRQSLLATCIALALLPTAARADDQPTLRSTGAPAFTAEAVTTLDSIGAPSVSVTITLPYAELNWVRLGDGYVAGATFSVELDPGNGGRLYGASWDRRLRLDSYAATRASRNQMVVLRSLAISPGRYRFRVHVRDVNSEEEATVDDQLTVQDLGKVPVGLSDLQLGLLDSAKAFVALPTRTYGHEVDHMAARAVAFDRRPGDWPRNAAFHWRILDDQDNLEAQGDTMLSVKQPLQTVVLRPGPAELFIGSYVLVVERLEGKARWRTTRSFEVEESGPPRGRDYTQLLEALAYIASSAEVDAMRKAPPEKQADLWDEFWRRRDPTPETPRNEYMIEFFRRLRYAEQHFQGFGAGWRSDMGRIYIKFGPADQVEQHAASSVTPQTEVWYYNQPYRRFVFADREGFGRYVLVQPSME